MQAMRFRFVYLRVDCVIMVINVMLYQIVLDSYYFNLCARSRASCVCVFWPTFSYVSSSLLMALIAIQFLLAVRLSFARTETHRNEYEFECIISVSERVTRSHCFLCARSCGQCNGVRRKARTQLCIAKSKHTDQMCACKKCVR